MPAYRLLSVPSVLIPLLLDVGGYGPQSPVPYQVQVDACLSVLLVLWSQLSPLEQQFYRRIIQQSDSRYVPFRLENN